MHTDPLSQSCGDFGSKLQFDSLEVVDDPEVVGILPVSELVESTSGRGLHAIKDEINTVNVFVFVFIIWFSFTLKLKKFT